MINRNSHVSIRPSILLRDNWTMVLVYSGRMTPPSRRSMAGFVPSNVPADHHEMQHGIARRSICGVGLPGQVGGHHLFSRNPVSGRQNIGHTQSRRAHGVRRILGSRPSVRESSTRRFHSQLRGAATLASFVSARRSGNRNHS